MPDNLGYAGGINAWLRPLMAVPGWKAAWILNPDTEPAPDAAAELEKYASARKKGLVGSRLVKMSDPDVVLTRGMIWKKLRAGAVAIDRAAAASEEPDADRVERLLDAPSGASLYATRDLIETIGLMSEHYFLYCEDLEWGVRAKKVGALGYAHQSVVLHKGGSTIGSAWKRKDRSRLSAYLEARNQILFVRERFPHWMPWTVAVGLGEVGLFLAEGAFSNAIAAIRGLVAGLAGEVGKPAWLRDR